MVVLHYTAMTRDGALARLCDPAAEVSAHYLICEKGDIYALVPEEMRAWHAGAGSWGGVADVNSRSIGIELSNRGDHPFAEAQMAALEELLRAIMARHDIPAHRVIGHSDMAPARKCDPGPRFDWRRLALGGLSVWPDVAADVAAEDAPDPEAVRAALARFGYDAGAPGDGIDPDLCAAFVARFGPLAARAMLPVAEDLAARFPVDAARFAL